jgi:hypothetical protein
MPDLCQSMTSNVGTRNQCVVCRCPETADIIGPGGERSSVLLRPLISCLVILTFLTLAACGPGGSGDSAGRERPPSDASAIRGFDLASDPAAQTLVQQVGGTIDVAAVIYADVTGDRREEAIVPVGSGGTMSNMAYLVYRLEDGKPQVVLTRTADRATAGGLSVNAEDGVLQEIRGVYGDEDPLCCPSQLRLTSFRWDGTRLLVASERVEKQENAGKY